jgi:hypothetical protein
LDRPSSARRGSRSRSRSACDRNAPQLGFNPEPGRAVLVARDGGIILYATTNEQGGYCLVISAPWKRPSNLPDGGTCIPRERAAAPLVAGLVGASSGPGDEQTYLIAGRTSDPAARTIRFADPGGASITRTIGSSGFFVASVRTDTPACTNGDWKLTFSVSGADGQQRSSATITLGSAPSGPHGVCRFVFGPHE